MQHATNTSSSVKHASLWDSAPTILANHLALLLLRLVLPVCVFLIIASLAIAQERAMDDGALPSKAALISRGERPTDAMRKHPTARIAEFFMTTLALAATTGVIARRFMPTGSSDRQAVAVFTRT